MTAEERRRLESQKKIEERIDKIIEETRKEKAKRELEALEREIMEDIIQEKISADHLLYVSLKYTKTCDVMINLILRWRRMIETSIEAILKHSKKKKRQR